MTQVDLVKKLVKRGYDEDPKKEECEGGYDYLLRMPIWSLTADKVRKLKNDIDSLQQKTDKLKATTEQEMWLRELDEFEKAYRKWLVNIDSQIVAKSKKKRR